MKLLSAQVRNYRIHRETSVDLADGLVLIHGPNESGKSTLAEAIHCALFLKAKGTTALHDAMSSDHGGTPEVKVEFEANGRRHCVRKTFGKSGDTVLESEGQPTLKGSEAEDRLAQLLGVDGAVSGGGIEGKMERRWGHLWVWQGKSSHTPLDSLEESQQQLREKLQAQSGQTVLTSPTDNAVIESLQAWESTQFTTTGKPKANSELDKAAKALESAQTRSEKARETLDQLRRAADAFLQAEADVERHGKNLREAESQLKTIREKLRDVGETRERLKDKAREQADAQKALDVLKSIDDEIRLLETQLREAETAIAPHEKEIDQLKAAKQDQQSSYEQARAAREDLSQQLKRLRSISDARQAHRDHLREARRVEELTKRLAAYQRLQRDQKELQRKLAPLEPFTSAALKSLAKAERAAEQARLQLEAYALQVHLLEADAPVTLDNEALETGKTHTLSRAADLCIGKTRIRLAPGGAADLEEARKVWQSASEKFEKELKSLAVESLDQAQERQRDRDNLTKDLAALQKQLDAAEADKLDSDLAEAQKSRDRLRAQRDAYAPEDDPLTFSDDLVSAEDEAERAREKLANVERRFQAAEAQEKASRRTLEKGMEALAKAEATHRELARKRDDLRSRLNHSLEKAGDADQRSRTLNDARGRLDQAKAAAKKEQDALDALGADQLELDAKRLTASASTDAEKLRQAQQRQIEARTELRTSGSQDPESQLKEAEAEAARCQKRHDALSHQAAVKRHLLEKLLAARQATTAALAKPLEDAVSPYLRLLFGGSRAQLQWSEDGSRLVSFALDRTDQRGGLFQFDQLSHGTREQVALALRLATAQLLAADYDGTLPLVLDDAFTHADRQRIEKLKSLLFQATQNGLQILLLSCHPENYSGLSATENAL